MEIAGQDAAGLPSQALIRSNRTPQASSKEMNGVRIQINTKHAPPQQFETLHRIRGGEPSTKLIEHLNQKRPVAARGVEDARPLAGMLRAEPIQTRRNDLTSDRGWRVILTQLAAGLDGGRHVDSPRSKLNGSVLIVRNDRERTKKAHGPRSVGVWRD